MESEYFSLIKFVKNVRLYNRVEHQKEFRAFDYRIPSNLPFLRALCQTNSFLAIIGTVKKLPFGKLTQNGKTLATIRKIWR